MGEWILMSDRTPEDEFFWAFIKGRMEYRGYRDSEIKILMNDHGGKEGMGDLRTLDAAGRYAAEGYTSCLSEWDNVIAWMPLDQMSLPEGHSLTS